MELRKRRGGFTLMEMLIVVAIIAILIAVAITIMGSSLEKSRDTATAANLRAAYAKAVEIYLTGDPDLITVSEEIIIPVTSVVFKSTDNSLGGLESGLPFSLCAGMLPEAGTHRVVFHFSSDDTVYATINDSDAKVFLDTETDTEKVHKGNVSRADRSRGCVHASLPHISLRSFFSVTSGGAGGII